MIVRDDGDGLIIIRQGDHAALAADIAKAWHPPGQPRQRPHNSLLVAAEHHDAGWRVWEDGTANPLTEDGRPRDFMHMPFEDHLTIWQASIDRATQYDLYAGLLTSMHAAALYEWRLDTQPDPAPVRALIQAFISQQAQWRAAMLPLLKERPHYAALLAGGGLAADLTLLQVWDTLSLMLCVPWSGPRTFEGVRFPGEGGSGRLTVTPEGEDALALDPYPLHQDPFPLGVTGRSLPVKTFARPAALAAAYDSAPAVELRFKLRASLSGS